MTIDKAVAAEPYIASLALLEDASNDYLDQVILGYIEMRQSSNPDNVNFDATNISLKTKMSTIFYYVPGPRMYDMPPFGSYNLPHSPIAYMQSNSHFLHPRKLYTNSKTNKLVTWNQQSKS
ncbi:hypothetical protein Fot_32849 [Forsythia ovata]|uniref:Uncharacterized protein n=1 Tax=Forsythia ovata TaxID=205694 RepID=A0ABD1T8Y2_9LAMI